MHQQIQKLLDEILNQYFSSISTDLEHTRGNAKHIAFGNYSVIQS